MCLSEIDCEARFNMHVPRVQSAVMTLEGNKNTDFFQCGGWGIRSIAKMLKPKEVGMKSEV